MMNIDNIKVLLEKFSSGVSTLEEEQQLADFFRNAKELPKELLPYKQMFYYFDNGMTDDNLLANEQGEPHLHARHSDTKPTKRTFALSIMSAAAAIAAVVSISYKMVSTGSDTPKRTVPQELVAQRVKCADSLSVEQDTVSSAERGTEQPREVRQPKKWLYKPAPPKVLLAENDVVVVPDSINDAAERMASNEIEKFEQEQQYMLNLVRAINIINSAEIASVADEVDAY